jgi:hypothetical protein
MPDGPTSSTLVQITCRGVLPHGQQSEFDAWEVRRSGREIVLTGRAIDQAALHGALDRLENLGLHVVEVSRRPKGHEA